MEAVAVCSEPTVAGSQTEVIDHVELAAQHNPPSLRLRLKKPKSDRKVGWREGTVDNEHMGKKKSKCCCIYKKPVAFGESSSEDDEECENCYGHPEKRKKNRKDHNHEQHDGGDGCNHEDDDPVPTCFGD